MTGLLANQFLRKVVDPRKWFDVDLAGPPLETKLEPRKRSRRIAFEQQKKQIFQELKLHNDKENKRRDQELSCFALTSSVAVVTTKVSSQVFRGLYVLSW